MTKTSDSPSFARMPGAVPQVFSIGSLPTGNMA